MADSGQPAFGDAWLFESRRIVLIDNKTPPLAFMLAKTMKRLVSRAGI